MNKMPFYYDMWKKGYPASPEHEFKLSEFAFREAAHPVSARNKSSRPNPMADKLFEEAVARLAVHSVYCRVDGGGDDGIVWIDNIQLWDGQKLTVDQFVEKLEQQDVFEILLRAGAIVSQHGISTFEALKAYVLNDSLFDIHEWAHQLFGNFHTGDFLCFGAFIVEFENWTILEDRDAVAEVRRFNLG